MGISGLSPAGAKKAAAVTQKSTFKNTLKAQVKAQAGLDLTVGDVIEVNKPQPGKAPNQACGKANICPAATHVRRAGTTKLACANKMCSRNDDLNLCCSPRALCSSGADDMCGPKKEKDIESKDKVCKSYACTMADDAEICCKDSKTDEKRTSAPGLRSFFALSVAMAVYTYLI